MYEGGIPRHRSHTVCTNSHLVAKGFPPKLWKSPNNQPEAKAEPDPVALTLIEPNEPGRSLSDIVMMNQYRKADSNFDQPDLPTSSKSASSFQLSPSPPPPPPPPSDTSRRKGSRLPGSDRRSNGAKKQQPKKQQPKKKKPKKQQPKKQQPKKKGKMRAWFACICCLCEE
jgi:hypothetical protein